MKAKIIRAAGFTNIGFDGFLVYEIADSRICIDLYSDRMALPKFFDFDNERNEINNLRGDGYDIDRIVTNGLSLTLDMAKELRGLLDECIKDAEK